MTGLAAAKREWRGLVKSLFAAVEPAELRALDDRLLRRLNGFAPLAAAAGGVLLGFSPLPDEPDVSPFFRAWLARGGRLALPVWLGGRALEFRLVRDWADLETGRGGIRQPPAGAPALALPAGEVAAAVVPGRAFSESCQRLGRGAGCYDALFARQACLKIGVAYDFQVFPGLPAGEADRPVDAVLTPGRIIEAQRNEE